MAASDHAARLRRLGQFFLIAMALLLGSAVGYVVLGGGADAGLEADVDPEVRDDPPLDPTHAPTIEFPEGRRTYDWQVNALIDRFIRITRQGRYTEFRTLWTQSLDPVSAEEYTHIWQRVRYVSVMEIRAIPAATRDGFASYLLRCEVRLDDAVPERQRQRNVRMLIVREGDRWVFAPPSRRSEGESP